MDRDSYAQLFNKIAFLNFIAKFKRKHKPWGLFLIKTVDKNVSNIMKIGFRHHVCFHVNFEKFFQDISTQVLLYGFLSNKSISNVNDKVCRAIWKICSKSTIKTTNLFPRYYSGAIVIYSGQCSPICSKVLLLTQLFFNCWLRKNYIEKLKDLHHNCQ